MPHHDTIAGTRHLGAADRRERDGATIALLDPATQNTPLAVREAYLDWTSGEKMLGHPFLSLSDMNPLKEAAKTERLARWKAAVDAKSTQAEADLGSRLGTPVEFLTDPESDLLFPLCAGNVLSQFEHFAEAHEWLSLLYDPVTRSKSPIFDAIAANSIPGNAIRTGDTWLDDTFDPIAIAFRREGTWLRYTILAMVRNLIAWADDEFARGLPDTLQRAEDRYQLARKLLGADQLENACETIILDIQKVIEEGLGTSKIEAARYSKPLLDLQSPLVLQRTAKDIRRAVEGQRSRNKIKRRSRGRSRAQ